MAPKRKQAAKREAVQMVEVRTPKAPAYRHHVEAPRYNAMKRALLKVVPKALPGLTQATLAEAVAKHLPRDLFPNMDKVVWWAKTVQLDLEARGGLVRHATKPLQWTLK